MGEVNHCSVAVARIAWRADQLRHRAIVGAGQHDAGHGVPACHKGNNAGWLYMAKETDMAWLKKPLL